VARKKIPRLPHNIRIERTRPVQQVFLRRKREKSRNHRQVLEKEKNSVGNSMGVKIEKGAGSLRKPMTPNQKPTRKTWGLFRKRRKKAINSGK